MAYTVLIPARLASSRLPDKPLALIAGVPMVVRVAQRAAAAGAARVVVAADDQRIVQACRNFDVTAVLTDVGHPSGSDRLAQACSLLGLADDEIVVNVQGDEPLIEPALIDACATLLARSVQASMSTAAHAITDVNDFTNPNVVKVVLDAHHMALYFSRAPIPWSRDAFAAGVTALPAGQGPAAALRHIGIYGYRAGFLREFTRLTPAALETCEALEQLRALWHGHRIAVHVTPHAPGPGVDTPQDLQRVRQLLGG
jgi:3-deoxy-manno-octulosonate cytidylyltransferase (CMP-KDO synthetase)